MEMRSCKWCIAAGIVVLGLLTAVCRGAAQRYGPEELLDNCGFEKWVNGQPAGWQGPRSSAAREKENVRFGTRSLKLTTAREGDYFRADLGKDRFTPLKPDTLYLASVWAKGSGRLRIVLSEYRGGHYVGSRSSIHADLTPQWRQYCFYYGTKGGAVEAVRFALALDGKDAVAFFDNASLAPVEPWRPPGPNVVPNGDMEADSDSDGRPDGWSSTSMDETTIGGREIEDVSVDAGPDGSRALVASCTPPPDRTRVSPDLTTWWDWAKQPPPAATWVVAASSPKFPLEPGRTYEVSFQTHGENVRTFHVKLRWLQGERGLRPHVFRLRRDGSWPWEEMRTRLTAPLAGVDAARLEFWARAGGGRLWVDNVSVRPSCTAEGWTVEKHQVIPLKTQAPAQEPAPRFAAREPVRFSFAPLARSRVRAAKDSLEVALKSGVTLEFRLQDGKLYGIGAVKLGSLPLRNPQAPPIAPLIETASGGHYISCRYLNAEVADDATVTIHTALTSATGREDALDWIFKPVERNIAGRRYVGFAYGYALETKGDDIHRIADRTSWELGGRALGLSVITQDAYSVQNVFSITPHSTECPHAGARFAHGDGLDYQYGPEGALVVFYDERISSVENNRRASTEWISNRDTIAFASACSVRTPLKCVLFCRQGNHDEWTRVRDYVYDRHAKLWGIRQHTPMPIMNCWMHWRDLARHGDRLLYNIADNVAPRLEELGFKVLVVHGIWSHGGCSPDFIEPAQKYGGTEALKYLCRKAARHGMTVQAWASTAHLWRHSPLLEQNPQWLIIRPDGKPYDGGYSDLRGVRFATGFADYALRQFKKVRDETGLGSLWLDSYAGFGARISSADRNIAIEQAQELFRYHGKLSQLGYIVYTEATGTFGIPACGFPVGNLDSLNPILPAPRTRYGLSNYVGDDPDMNRVLVSGDYYYRLLANKAPCMLYWQHFKEMPEAHAKVARANHDYNRVVDRMKYRHTLPDERGVEWTNPDDSTRILFSYRKGRYSAAGITKAFDVTAGKAVELATDGFATEPSHTYRITFAAPEGTPPGR